MMTGREDTGHPATRLTKITHRSVSTEVYERLKESVLDGTLPPGTRLVETHIAEQLGVSRSPVREAFLLLESDGLIVNKPNEGVLVRELSDEEIWEIYTARIVLEGYLARLAAERATAEDIERLHDALERLLDAVNRDDFPAAAKADFRLHRLIWHISGHELLYDILSKLEIQVRRFMNPQPRFWDDSLHNLFENHRDIVQAIADGDPQGARVQVERHIEWSARSVMKQPHATPPSESSED